MTASAKRPCALFPKHRPTRGNGPLVEVCLRVWHAQPVSGKTASRTGLRATAHMLAVPTLQLGRDKRPCHFLVFRSGDLPILN